jgi:hypothetical protein
MFLHIEMGNLDEKTHKFYLVRSSCTLVVIYHVSNEEGSSAMWKLYYIEFSDV